MATRARKSSPSTPASIVVVYGDEEFRKQSAIQQALDALLPPEVDRAMALCQYDGAQSEEQGGATFARVADDLATLPFLADRRVVLVREADKFVSASREKLERLVGHFPPTGALILECRSFPKTTKLYKAIAAAGGAVQECKKLYGAALQDFVVEAARDRGKRIEPAAAKQLVDLVGQEQGVLASEVEKLALYVGSRDTISRADVTSLVGQSREERIFAVMDAAGLGQMSRALELWHDVLATDRDAAFRATGGMAFVLRKWLTAHKMAAEGTPIRSIAPKVIMYGRDQELATILRRLSAGRIARVLAALADLDMQAKSGARSIETGIEGLLVRVAAAAA